MAVIVHCPFLTVPWVGLQCVTVAFSGHAHFRFFFFEKYGDIFFVMVFIPQLISYFYITCFTVNNPEF